MKSSLARTVLIPSGLTAAESATYGGMHKKDLSVGNFRFRDCDTDNIKQTNGKYNENSVSSKRFQCVKKGVIQLIEKETD